jgi:transaldolase
MKIEIYADGPTVEELTELTSSYPIAGITTNPTLMKKIGVRDYKRYSQEILEKANGLPVSLEILSNETSRIVKEAKILQSWGENVFVKIPIRNTDGKYLYQLISELSHEGVQLNITAVFTESQIDSIHQSMSPGVSAILSVFAGRIADTGKNPEVIVKHALEMHKDKENTKVLWASPREPYNIIQAENIGCHIITLVPDLIRKTKSFGKALEEFSLETSQMFFNDAQSCNFTIEDGEY